MKGNKVGTMFFISILVLAGIGISYAGFTDSIAIYGSVNTATVDIELVGWYSGTWVYKIWGFTVTPIPPIFDYDVYDLANEILIIRGYAGHVATIADVSDWAAANGGNAQLVSFSEAKEGTTHDETPYDVDFIYDNLFPCIDFSADFIFHYAGSIPAKIDTAIIHSENPWLQELWAMYQDDPAAGFGAYVEAYRCYPWIDEETGEITGWYIDYEDPVDVGYQLHYCYYVYVKLVIHIPQDNDYQGLKGIFTAKIGVIQWNDQCVDNPPIVVIESPEDGTTVETPYVTVSGYATDDHGLFSEGYSHKWTANPTGVAISGTIPMPYPTYYPLSYPFTLEEGWNEITFFVTDDAGQYGEDSIEIYFYIPPGPAS